MKPAAILLTTFHKHEHLIDACIESLDYTWPEHPQVIVLSDRGRFQHSQKILTDSTSWTCILQQGISESIAQGLLSPEDSILLLLEDHVPLSPLPLERLAMAFETMTEYKLPYLALFGHGKSSVFKEGPERIYERAADYRFYSELHPALWRVAYLKEMTKLAIRDERHSAWEFETQAGQANHYTTDSLWTSELGGFLAEGRVDWGMLRKMKAAEFRKLRRKLRYKAIRALPRRVCQRILRKS